MAIGVMHGLRERGVRTQDFPAFVGYDDSDAGEMAVPALSSVRVPFFEMGELAVSKLMQGTNGIADARGQKGYHSTVTFDSLRTLLPTELIIRASSNRRIEE
jgi:LacI family transcriptional regulator